MKPGPEKALRLFTIGHSNRTFEDFLSLLSEFNISTVADIRRYPSSRKFPHFNSETLRQLLDAQDIHYIWLEALGGRRHTAKNNQSPNTGLRSPGFRNYADHMTTDEFRTAVWKLLSTAAVSPTAIMCAEKFYWKCHRRLLSDYLTAQGVEMEHIVESGKLQPHKLSAGAVITSDATVVYPSPKPAEMQAQELF
ncbi:MAG: DUF488 domain-containing protein [Planctomycetota bacterium]|jgi:uncharacterized protein (DUF488 family)